MFESERMTNLMNKRHIPMMSGRHSKAVRIIRVVIGWIKMDIRSYARRAITGRIVGIGIPRSV
jgi:hypothetical protein